MKNIYSIFRRELGAYFNSAIAYIFIIVFLLVNSVLYMSSFFIALSADMRSFFSLMPIILVVFLPAITMRLWAEDKKSGTIELLMTFPMPSYQVVLGKFFAGYLFFLMALAGTFTIPIMLVTLGNPDMGPIYGGYFGVALMGAFYLAVGIFISGLSNDQIVAFIVAMVACFLLYISGTGFMAMQIDGWIPGLGTFIANYIGLGRHFESIERGILDVKDIAYFISMAAFFLFLNGFSLKDRFKPGAKTKFAVNVAIMGALVLFFQVVMGGAKLGRFDLTENQIFSVSPSGVKILAQLKAPVQIKYYVSPREKMPSQFKDLEDDVVGKLEEFSLASGGKLNYEIVRAEGIGQFDDDSKSEKDDLNSRLSERGIQPFQVQTLENDELAIKVIYSAISIGYKDKKDEIIPRLLPANFGDLEYELLSKVFRMARDKKPLVALYSPVTEQRVDPRMAQLFLQAGKKLPPVEKNDDYKYLPQLLEHEGYSVRKIDFTRKQPIPDEADTVIVVSPDSLSERQRYEINKALYQGKSVILAPQTYKFNYQLGRGSVKVSAVENKPGVNELIKFYGVEVDDSFLMDENQQVINLSKGESQGLFQILSQQPVKLPIHIMLKDSSMNKEVSITSRLSSIFYLWGNALKLDKEKLDGLGLTAKTFITTSEKSWKVPFHAGFLMLKDFNPPGNVGGKFPVAALVEGKFPDIFDGKERPEWPTPKKFPGQDQGFPQEKEEEPEAPEKSFKEDHKPAKLLVFGAGEIFKDNVIGGGAGNLALFINSVDALTLGNELISIRGKKLMDRRLDKLDKGERLTWRFFTIVMLPLVFAGIGIARWFLKRKSREAYLRIVGEVR